MRKNQEDEQEDNQEDESEEDEQEDNQEDESKELEDIVESSFIAAKRTNRAVITPNLEMSDNAQPLEKELRNIPANTPEDSENTEQSSQYSIDTNYASSSYQSSNYDSSIYPKTISQESVNPFLSPVSSQFSQPNQSMGFRIQSQPGTSMNTGEYPKETEIRKYQPVSGQKRDRKKY